MTLPSACHGPVSEGVSSGSERRLQHRPHRDSIKDDVRQFLESGAISNSGIANSLLAKLDIAAASEPAATA